MKTICKCNTKKNGLGLGFVPLEEKTVMRMLHFYSHPFFYFIFYFFTFFYDKGQVKLSRQMCTLPSTFD